MQVTPEDVTAKGMDMGDVLKGEAAEKVITITNTGQSSDTIPLDCCMLCLLSWQAAGALQCSVWLGRMTVLRLVSVALAEIGFEPHAASAHNLARS